MDAQLAWPCEKPNPRMSVGSQLSINSSNSWVKKNAIQRYNVVGARPAANNVVLMLSTGAAGSRAFTLVDPGSTRPISHAISSGPTPPSTKMLRQLQPNPSPRAVRAATAPPSGMAAMTAVTVLRRPRGPAASEDSPMKAGSAPPSPKPVSNRATSSESGPTAMAVNSEQNPNSSIETSSVLRSPR